MAAGWIVMGARTQRPVVLAAGAADGAARAAAARVDDALDGFPGGVPAWFRGIERLGRWLYVAGLAIGIALCLVLVPSELQYRLSSGVLVGLMGTRLGGPLLRVVAAQWSKARGPGSVDAAVAAVADVARPANGELAQRAETVLAVRPELDARLHGLLWRSAGGDHAAGREISGLWEQTAPERAAEQAALIAAAEAKIAALKERRGG